jgi:excisionase family DNA binding protein
MGITGARGTVVRQYLTRSEVARLFEVSPATVARWTREGKLPFVLTLGGQRRYVRDQVMDLLPRMPRAATDTAGRKSDAFYPGRVVRERPPAGGVHVSLKARSGGVGRDSLP